MIALRMDEEFFICIIITIDCQNVDFSGNMENEGRTSV
jgi:hypothetical protein